MFPFASVVMAAHWAYTSSTVGRLDVQPPLGPLVYQWRDGRAAVELLGLSPHALVYGLSIPLVSQDDGDPGTLHLVHLGMV